MKKCLFLLLIVFLFFSCSKRQTGFLPVGADYTIDLDGDKESSMPYSSIFKKAQTIILETGKDCMIGNINELQVFDGSIYILDSHVAKTVFVFDREGRFIRKIGSLGSGPGEYIRVSDFTLDTEHRFIFLCDDANRIHKYQLDGTYIHSITLPISKATTCFIQYYKGILYASILAWEPAEDDYMLLGIDPNNGKILSRSLPLKYNKGWAQLFFTGHSFFLSRLNSPPRYAQLFMDEVVSIGEDISPYIQLKSKNLVTEKDVEKLQEFWDKDFREVMNYFRGKIWDVQSFVENDDFILFNYNYAGSMGYFTVLFHKETRTVKLAKKLSNDLVLRQGDDANSSMSAVFGKFSFSDTQGAYEVVSPRIFYKFLESLRNNECVPDLDKLDQLMQLNEESNPVIFYYEFK